MESLINAFSLDWRTAIIDFLHVAAAFALAIPIGWERHRSERNLGLRTFPIVATGACGFILLLKNAPGASAETHARLIQGLVGGIGFIGGGAILKEGASIRGFGDRREHLVYGGHWCCRRVRSGGDRGDLKRDHFFNLTAAYTSH